MNDQEFHSSNLTVELENFNDAIIILIKFSGKYKKEVLDELEYSGVDFKNKHKYLHYLKLIKDCGD